MITTITLNAAMDRTLVVPNFLLGRRHRASSSVTLPGGKGINTARALKRLGTPVIATGLAGGLTGANIVERLTFEGILNDFVRIAEPSRTSTAVIDPVNGAHTEINEYGPRVAPGEIELMTEKLRYLARASQVMVLAGTLPRAVEHDLYQRLVRTFHAQSLLTVISTPDDTDVLRLALAAEPGIVILEQREAESLVGNEFNSDEDFVIGLDEIAQMGGQTVIIMHETGCFARVREARDIVMRRAFHAPVESVSELGSADSFIAGYLHSLLAERPIDERLAFGLGAVLANRQSLGAGDFDKGDAVRMQKDVTVEAIVPVEVELDVE